MNIEEVEKLKKSLKARLSRLLMKKTCTFLSLKMIGVQMKVHLNRLQQGEMKGVLTKKELKGKNNQSISVLETYKLHIGPRSM